MVADFFLAQLEDLFDVGLDVRKWDRLHGQLVTTWIIHY